MGAGRVASIAGFESRRLQLDHVALANESTVVLGSSRAPRLAASVGVQRSTCGVFEPPGGWFLALERSLHSASRRSYVPENSSRSQSSVRQIDALFRSGLADREDRRVGGVWRSILFPSFS
jgi:hypothetical protein